MMLRPAREVNDAIDAEFEEALLSLPLWPNAIGRRHARFPVMTGA